MIESLDPTAVLSIAINGQELREDAGSECQGVV
jgi:hypothetical protein